MNSLKVFERLGVSDGAPDDHVTLTELLPTDLDPITAVMSVRENIHPKPFSFEVCPETILVGIRLEGTGVITSRKWGTSHLIQAGDVYFFSDGKYDSVFGKRRSKTLFILAERNFVVGLEHFQREHRGHVPITTIDLENDPIAKKIAAVSDLTSKHSYFKFNSLLSDVLDKLVEPDDTILTRYGIHQLDPVFTKLCLQVVESPSVDWNTQTAAEACGYSVYHFSRTFRAKADTGFHEFVNRVRAIQAIDMICASGTTRDQDFEQLGFPNNSAAAKAIQRELGLNLNDIARVLAPVMAAMAI